MTQPDAEVIEALRDAISFIQGTSLLHRNDGTDISRRRAAVCDEVVAKLSPVYGRLIASQFEGVQP